MENHFINSSINNIINGSIKYDSAQYFYAPTNMSLPYSRATEAKQAINLAPESSLSLLLLKLLELKLKSPPPLY